MGLNIEITNTYGKTDCRFEISAKFCPICFLDIKSNIDFWGVGRWGTSRISSGSIYSVFDLCSRPLHQNAIYMFFTHENCQYFCIFDLIGHKWRKLSRWIFKNRPGGHPLVVVGNYEPQTKVLSIKEKKYSSFYFLRVPGHSGQFLRNEKLIFSNFSQ